METWITRVALPCRVIVLSLLALVAFGAAASAREPSATAPDAGRSAANGQARASGLGADHAGEAPAAKDAALAGPPSSLRGAGSPDEPTPRPPKAIVVPMKEGGVVYWIEVHDVIDLGLAPFVERVVDTMNADPKAVALVSEIHTPGGRVDAAVRIRDALLRAKHPTIAFIHSEAISAGALIALAHDFLVVVPGGAIGAATPIHLGASGEAKATGEKIVSYVRGVFRSTAEAKGRDPRVAEAMVDARTVVPGLAPEGKLLTATASEALEWGIVDAKVKDTEDFIRRVGIEGATIRRLGVNWAEAIARALTHPMVSSLLMTFGFLGLLMEFYTPGFGVMGGIGVTCLLLFFFGHSVVHLAGAEEIGLFVLGVVLLGLEVFVIPGFGVVGVLGILAILAALILSLVALPLDVSIDSGQLTAAVARVMLAFTVTVLVGIFLGRALTRSGPFQRLVLKDAIRGTAVGFGQPSAQDAAEVVAPAPGTPGVARTDLRPSGKVLVGGKSFDAITSGESILRGAEIEVRGTRSSALLVRARPTPPVEEPDGAPA